MKKIIGVIIIFLLFNGIIFEEYKIENSKILLNNYMLYVDVKIPLSRTISYEDIDYIKYIGDENKNNNNNIKYLCNNNDCISYYNY